MKVATDDDYIPFVGLTPTGDNDSQLSASQARVTYKPPPPSIFGSSEPEIRLRVEEDTTEDISARKHEATSETVEPTPAPLAVKYAHRNVRNKRSEVFDLLLKKKAATAKDKTKRTEKTEKYEKTENTENTEKAERPKYNEVKAAAETEDADEPLIQQRAGKWTLPSLDLDLEGPITKVQYQVLTLPTKDMAAWKIQKAALQKKFGVEGWNPIKKLSPDAMDGIRALHAQDKEQFSTENLADLFEMSPEAIRRILRSKWKPSEQEQENRQERWNKRGEEIFSSMIDRGIIKTKSMKKKERKQRTARANWESVTDKGINISDKMF
jgi:hypothetical protein